MKKFINWSADLADNIAKVFSLMVALIVALPYGLYLRAHEHKELIIEFAGCALCMAAMFIFTVMGILVLP